MIGPSTEIVWQWGSVSPTSYRCGWCYREVASSVGGSARPQPGNNKIDPIVIRVLVCPACSGVSILDAIQGAQVPGFPLAEAIARLPKDVEAIYNEARHSTTVNAYTAAALCCRKLLMHVAVSNGAAAGETFASYVDWLLQKNLVPANAKPWIDSIRKTGNEATHEIKIVDRAEAEHLLAFTQMLLQLIYDFPNRMKGAR
jgi:hypothetical protein